MALFKLSDEELARDVVQNTILAAKEEVQLSMHKSMCKACTQYEKQSFILDHALEKSARPEKVSLDLDAFRNEIIRRMGEMK